MVRGRYCCKLDCDLYLGEHTTNCHCTLARNKAQEMASRRLKGHDLGGFPSSSPQKVVVDLEYACSSLCTNQSGNLLAVVGRKVFKILKLSPDSIEHAIDLRDLPHKQLNLNFSSNDVQWNPKEDSQLATAPTNGSVVLWNIKKNTKSKIAHIFDGAHVRAVNRLSFHHREANLLLSGSQDNTMNIFDTHNLNVVQTYKGPDSVRDVKFPTLVSNDNLFAACYDNGVLHVWDRRRNDHPVKTVACHNGPVYCCMWHPDSENLIMTAGRDKMIKGFNIEGRPRETISISTRFSVARAKWRPAHQYHVTSCSHFLDITVMLWDTRRPFIPFASFTEHGDDVTDFLWLNEEVLLTCSKDGKLIQQLLRDAQKPVEKASPVGLSFRPDGALAHACSENLAHRRTSIYNSQSSSVSSSRPSIQPMSFRRSDEDTYQQSFLLHTSSLREHEKLEPVTKGEKRSFKDIFIKCAKSYKLHGLPVYELCDHNYKVAKELGLEEVSQTWIILKLLYCGEDQDCSRLGLIDTTPPSRAATSSRLSNAQTSASVAVVVDSNSEVHSSTAPAGRESTADNRPPTRMREAMSSTVDSAQEENEEDIEGSNGPAVDAALDFFEGDDNASDVDDPQPSPPHGDWTTEMQLPAEPIQLRHDLVLRPPTPEHIDTASGISTAHSGLESSSSMKPPPGSETMNYRKSSSQLKSRPRWDFSSVVTDMLKFYAEQGNVQMSVSCMLALGEKAKGLVDDRTMEHWFSSYIDLLSRYKLWSVTALVINLCPLHTINEMNQQSTTYHTGCGHCNKVMEGNTLQCQRCLKTASICSVCHNSVRGIYVWCQVCGHGGHLQHIQDWHKDHAQCPTGCGHSCAQVKA